MTKGSNITKPIVFLNKLLLASFAILFFSCAQKTETTRPVIENITESVYASGVVKAKNQYQVFANVSGTINKIMVTENDVVKKGTPLSIVLDKSVILNRENAVLAADY